MSAIAVRTTIMLNAGYTHLLFHRSITFQLVSVVALKFFLVSFFCFCFLIQCRSFIWNFLYSYTCNTTLRRKDSRTTGAPSATYCTASEIRPSEQNLPCGWVFISLTDFLMVTCKKLNKHGDPRLTFIWPAIKKKSFMLRSFDKFIVS